MSLWKLKRKPRGKRGAALAIVLFIAVISLIIISYIINLNMRRYQAARYGLSKDLLLQVDKEVTMTVVAALRRSTYWDFNFTAANVRKTGPMLRLNNSNNIENLANDICYSVLQNRDFGALEVRDSTHSSSQVQWSCSGYQGPNELITSNSPLSVINSILSPRIGMSATTMSFTLTPQATGGNTNVPYNIRVDVTLLYTGVTGARRGSYFNDVFSNIPLDFQPILAKLGYSLIEPMRIWVSTTAYIVPQSGGDPLYSKKTYWIFSVEESTLALLAPYAAIFPHLYDPFGLDVTALETMNIDTRNSIGYSPSDAYMSGFAGLGDQTSGSAVFSRNSLSLYGNFMGTLPGALVNAGAGRLGIWSSDNSSIPQPLASKFYGDVSKLIPSDSNNISSIGSEQFFNQFRCTDASNCTFIASKIYLNNPNLSDQLPWTIKTPQVMDSSSALTSFDTVNSNGRYSFPSKIANYSQTGGPDPTTLYLTIKAGDSRGVVNINDRRVVQAFQYDKDSMALVPQNWDDSSGRWVEVPWNDANDDQKLNTPYLSKLLANALKGPTAAPDPEPEDAMKDEWLRMNSNLPGVANFIMSTRFDPNTQKTVIRVRAVGKYSGKPITDFSCANNVTIPSGAQGVQCRDMGNGEIRIEIDDYQNQNDTNSSSYPRKVAVAVRGGNVIYAAPSRYDATPGSYNPDSTDEPVLYAPKVPITIVAEPSDTLTTRDIPGQVPTDMLKNIGVKYSNGQITDPNDNPVNIDDYFFVGSVSVGGQDVRKVDLDGDNNPDVSFGETGMWIPLSSDLLEAIKNGSGTSTSIPSGAFKFVLPDPNDSYDTAYQRFRALMSLEGNIILTNEQENTIYNFLANGGSDEAIANLSKDAVAGIGIPLTGDDYDNLDSQLDVDNVSDLLSNPNVRNTMDKKVTYTDSQGNPQSYEPQPVNLVATNYVFLLPIDYASNGGWATGSNKLFAYKGIIVSLNHTMEVLDKDAAKYLLAPGDKVLNEDSWYDKLYQRMMKKDLNTDYRSLFLLYGGLYTVFGDVEGILVNDSTILGFDSQLYMKLPDKVMDTLLGNDGGEGILDLATLKKPIKMSQDSGEYVPITLEMFFEE